MPNTLAAKPITDAMFTRLKQLSGVTWYRGDVPDHPPSFPDSDRVAPYGVLYPLPGRPGTPDQQSLGYANVDLDWGCQVTVAAGFQEDCEYTIDRVQEHLLGYSLVVADVVVGQLRPPIGFTPGTVVPDRSILPPRFSLAIQYRLVATAN